MQNVRLFCHFALEINLIEKRCNLIGQEHLPIKCQGCPDIETSQLICRAHQLTGFYMRATLARNGLNSEKINHQFFQ